MVKKNNKNIKKGQALSVDVLVVVVILLLGVVFLVVNQIRDMENENNDISKLKIKADQTSKLIVGELKNKNILDSENNVEVENLLQLDIDELKQELAIEGDFAIVFEKDGTLVRIDSEKEINCVGSENIIVNEAICKSS